MTKRMLIDATHAEETRVVVLEGSRIEDYDVETASKRQLKGNIYLAKVVRVEPSLQAAFVEYGGNRHGFLAFDEIHPDYYQIPVADREKLLALEEAEVQAAAAAEEAEAAGDAAAAATRGARVAQAIPATRRFAEPPGDGTAEEPASGPGDVSAEATGAAEESVTSGLGGDATGDVTGDPVGDTAEVPPYVVPAGDAAIASASEPVASPSDESVAAEWAAVQEAESLEADTAPETPPETVGGEGDSTEDLRPKRTARHFLRQYKIQEVIHRRQIVLVQVVKEERGAKGAALTTYISLAGRYCVLMPNSPRGGGISRKITAPGDRKRLKEIIAELAIPSGMGLIVRTAGANRPKPEIRRDCEYLLRLWDEIRDTVMKSVAPALVYEEASLIKRAIRDVYSREIAEVLVDGEAAWQAAREFMRTLMPAHVRKVVLWQNGGQSLFAHERVEAELDGTLVPTVPLRSGGSLVINQTEALVAIDVNSGRATRERNIEETALRTNLEAAEEVSRQLRLRDLAGLIVIDFIDMEVRKHNAMIERRLKESLKGDRARVQVGRISHFGLLEMSRQRLHSSLDETSFSPCPECGGTGHVRSVESSAVHLLRALEDEAARKGAGNLVVHAAPPVELYILNHKRAWLAEVETRHSVSVSFTSERDQPVSLVAIERLPGERLPGERLTERTGAVAKPAPVAPAPAMTEAITVPIAAEEKEASPSRPAEAAPAETQDDRERHHRRRRRRRRRDETPEADTNTLEETVPLPPELAEQPEVVVAPAMLDSEAGEGAGLVQATPEPRQAHGRPRPTRRPREPRPRRVRGTPAAASAEDTAAAPLPAEVAPPDPMPPAPSPLPPVALVEPARSPLPQEDAPAQIVEGPPHSPPIAPIDNRPPVRAIRPVVVGDEPSEPAVKKRGWWRR